MLGSANALPLLQARVLAPRRRDPTMPRRELGPRPRADITMAMKHHQMSIQGAGELRVRVYPNFALLRQLAKLHSSLLPRAGRTNRGPEAAETPLSN